MKRVTGLSVNMCSGQERKMFCDFIKHTKKSVNPGLKREVQREGQEYKRGTRRVQRTLLRVGLDGWMDE